MQKQENKLVLNKKQKRKKQNEIVAARKKCKAET